MQRAGAEGSATAPEGRTLQETQRGGSLAGVLQIPEGRRVRETVGLRSQEDRGDTQTRLTPEDFFLVFLFFFFFQ